MTVPADSIPAVMSPKQFAALTGMNTRTVASMCASGRLPAKKVPGSKLWRISGAAVKAWLQSLNADPASQHEDEGARHGD